MVHNSQPSAYIVTEIGTFCKGGNADEAAQANQKRSRQPLPSPGDLFAQPPAAFYRLPEFELRGSSLLTRDCRRVLEFSPEKICLDMGSFTVTFYGAALQIESLTGKSLILTGKIRRIDFANKWGEEP